MKVVVHDSLMPALVALLTAFDDGHAFERFPYPENTSPDEWLLAIGKDRPPPAILCLSSSILKSSVGHEDLRSCGCVYICLNKGWKNLPWSEFCANLLRVWPEINRILSQTSPPAIIRVPTNAKPFRDPL